MLSKCVTLCAVLTYLLTYLLTPWSRVLPEKLTGSQLVKKFPAFYGTRKLITAFTKTHQLSLSWVREIQTMPTHHTSWSPVLILSYHLRLGLPSGLFPSGLPTKILSYPPFVPCAHLDLVTRIIFVCQVSSPLYAVSAVPSLKSPLRCICCAKSQVPFTLYLLCQVSSPLYAVSAVPSLKSPLRCICCAKSQVPFTLYLLCQRVSPSPRPYEVFSSDVLF